MLREIRLALRTLTRRPGATGLVVVLLALGLGADLLVFTVMQSMLLRPLDYPEPDGMVRIGLLHYNTAEEVRRLLQALGTV